MPDVENFAKYVSTIGVAGLLAVVVWFLLKGIFVTGREHAQTLSFVSTLQSDLASLRTELSKLRDRDETQQRAIDQLRDQLTREQELKVEALAKLTEAQGLIESLRKRVQELERQVNPARAVQT
jgi:chromosome segregation ATPase